MKKGGSSRGAACDQARSEPSEAIAQAIQLKPHIRQRPGLATGAHRWSAKQI